MVDCSALLEVVAEEGFAGWEEAIKRVVDQYGRELSVGLFETVDQYLASRREPALRLIGYRTRTVIGKHGQLKVRRRLYRDSDGNYRFLLDEALGLVPKKAATPALARCATALAAHVPFRVAAELLAMTCGQGLSHQSIHKLVAAVGESELATESFEAAELFSMGALPTSTDQRPAQNLYLEADGCAISLQREKNKTAEVKIGVAYSGKAGGALKDKVVHLDLTGGAAFWQRLTVKVAKVFNLATVRNVVVGGDGAAWVRGGQALFAHARFRLDPFHVARAIKRAVGHTAAASKATGYAFSGDVSAATAVLDAAKDGADRQKVKQIQTTKRYLKNNADGLGPGPSLGAIESNVDKLVANRMKKRGMAWSTRGARRMLKLLERRAAGNWSDLPLATPDITPAEAGRASAERALAHDPEAWLRAHIAAFDGPHASRLWVKLLRQISMGQELSLAGLVPTER